MTEMFLLGAGASVEAGVPHAYMMTNEMLNCISKEAIAKYNGVDKVLKFVIGGLLFQQGIKGENPFEGVNIEDLFNAVLLLGDRQNSELSPFISSWHPKIIGMESGRLTNLTSRELLRSINEPVEKYVREITQDGFEQISRGRSFSTRRGEIDTFFSSSRFEEKFKEAVQQIVSGSEGRLFKATANAMIENLVNLVWITDGNKVQYLFPLLDFAKNTNSSFVTLNYDNTIELASRIMGNEVDTGFDAWSNTSEFSFEDGKIPLIKLHGSIDWALNSGKTDEEKPLPYQIIQKVNPNSSDQNGFHPAVLFGGKNKLTAKGPFLSLLRSFEKQLEYSEVLTVIGYSFRDEHVNEFITKWLNGNISRKMRIINPNPESFDDPLTHALLHGRGQNRVEVIKESTSNGILRITGAQ